MLKIALCIITTDFYKEEKYVLSIREDSISLPYIEIDNYKNLTDKIKDVLNTQIFQDTKMASEYVNPKFISINDNNICKLFTDSDSNLYFLYGCICPKLLLHTNYFWKTFDIYDQTIITELRIINDVIEHTI
jgi:hypothetical protein